MGSLDGPGPGILQFIFICDKCQERLEDINNEYPINSDQGAFTIKDDISVCMKCGRNYNVKVSVTLEEKK